MNVNALILDKLSFTAFVCEEDKEEIYDYLLTTAQDEDAGLSIVPPHSNYLKIYRLGVYLLINPDTGYKCTIHASPYNDENAYLRFEWSPANAGDSGYEYIKDLINILKFDRNSLKRNHFAITRMDFAVDIVGAHPDDLLISVRGMSRSGAYYDVYGRTETQYIGHQQGNRKYKFYDKTAETARRRGVNIPQTTRVEASLKKVGPVGSLQSIANPFSRVSLEEWERFEGVNDRRRTMFLDSCRQRGKQAALRLYCGSNRQMLNQWSAHIGEAAWWEPEAIWEGGWPTILSSLRGVFGYRVRLRP